MMRDKMMMNTSTLSPTNLYVDQNGRTYLSEGHYVFSVDNKSISEHYILNPFWNWFTYSWIPDSIAPNVVTFSGFILMLITFALVWLNYPYCDVPYHVAYCAMIPVLMFLYQTLDGCDGKQARRTKSSSPLGELFDHGVDALCMTIFAQSLMTILGVTAVNHPILSALTHINMWYSFYSAHWEHYHSDYFFMGYIGACDGQLIIMGVYFIGLWNQITNPILYPTIVHYFMNNVVTVPFLNIELSYGVAWIAFAFINGLGSIGRCIAAIFWHYFKNKDQTPNKRNSFIGSLFDLLPLTVMSLTWFIWISFNHFYSVPIPVEHSSIQPHPLAPLTTLWQRDSMWFVSTGGLAFGMYLTTINISRVTIQPFQYFSFQNFFTVGIMIIQLLNSLIRLAVGSAIVEEALLLRICCIVSLIVYLDFVTNVARNFSKAMNIYIFKLGKRIKEAKKMN